MLLSGIPILVYHQIAKSLPSDDPMHTAVLFIRFERQMRYLHDHGFHCLSLMEILQHSENNRMYRKRTFALTFDDGYQDFFTRAFPILRRYGFTATVFLITKYVGGHIHWKGTMDARLLTWGQIHTMQKEGISFGSHTWTHRSLIGLPEQEIWHELVGSKERLEAELGEEVKFLAYPYGESNSDVRKMAMAAGYLGACGLHRGRSGRFNLRRREIHTFDNMVTFRLKLTCCHWIPLWMRRKTLVGKLMNEAKGGFAARRG